MVALNFFLFVPLGFLLPLALRFKKHRSLKVILIAVLFSVLIETVQIFIGRFFEIDDIIANSLGAVSGALLWQGIYWIKTKQIKKGILGIVSAFIVGSLFLAGVSFIANGDRLQEELLQKYSELPEDTELENNLDHIDVSSGLDAKASAKTFEGFDFANVYLEMKLDITNNISQYGPKQAAELKSGSDDILISVYLNEPQTFTFRNNPDITMENVVSWSYDINDGSIWYTDSSGNESMLSFVGRDDAFVRNEKLFGQANDLLDKYNQSKIQQVLDFFADLYYNHIGVKKKALHTLSTETDHGKKYRGVAAAGLLRRAAEAVWQRSDLPLLQRRFVPLGNCRGGGHHPSGRARQHPPHRTAALFI